MTFSLLHKSNVSSDRTDHLSLARKARRMPSRRKGQPPERNRRLQFENLEARVVLAAVPFVTLPNIPTDVLIGEPANMAMTFRNSSPTDVGFGLFRWCAGFRTRNCKMKIEKCKFQIEDPCILVIAGNLHFSICTFQFSIPVFSGKHAVELNRCAVVIRHFSSRCF